MTLEPHRSSSRAARVDAVDLARGIALTGMMLVHLGPVWIHTSPPIGDLVAAGRAAPLFAMLAGVALTLVHRRDPAGAGSVRATCARAAVLIALGLSLGSLHDMPVLIILAFYGLLIVVALPFRSLPATTVLVLGGAWAVVAPVVLLLLQIRRDPFVLDQAELSDLQHPLSLLGELVLWGAYPAGVWFAYVLVGMGIGRLDLGSFLVARRLLATGVALVAATLTVGWIAIAAGVFDDGSTHGWPRLFSGTGYPYETAGWKELLLVGVHTSRPLNVVGAIGSALLVIGASSLALRVPWARLALLPLRAAGTMTLSLYIVHVLWTWRMRVGSIADTDPLGAVGSYRDWLVQVVVLGAFAVLWQRFVGRGPLEQLVRLVSVTGPWSSGRTRKNAPA